MDIKIIEIILPKWEAVRKGNPGQELTVLFSVGKDKFRCVYTQEHYFYRGIPGIWHENCIFQKIKSGEIISKINCSGEIFIPHEGELRDAYDTYNYDGDDERYLHATEEIVMEYLIEPFVKRYC